MKTTLFLERTSSILNGRIGYLLIFFVLLGALALRGYYGSMKEGLHMDESLTFTISSCDSISYSAPFISDKEYTGREIQKEVYGRREGLKGMAKDLYNLRIDVNDQSHSNIYYSLIRIFIGDTEACNVSALINRGVVLNIILFLLCFGVTALLLRNLGYGKILIAVCLAFMYLNTGTVSCTMFIRRYQLEMLAVMVFAIVFIRYYRKIMAGENIRTWQDMLLLSASISFLLLSDYFMIVYLGVMGIFLVYKSLKMQNKQNVVFLVVTFLLSFVFSSAFYSKFLAGFVPVGQTSAALSKFGPHLILDNLIVSLRAAFSFLHEDILNLFLLIPVLGILVLMHWKKKESFLKREDSILWIISLISFFIICILAPHKDPRYVYPVMPLVCLVFPIFVRQLKNKLCKMLVVLLIVGISVIKVYDINKIDFLYKDTEQSQFFKVNAHVPLVVVNESYSWYLSDIVPYIQREQRVIFYDNLDSLSEDKMHNCYLLLDKNSEMPLFNKIEVEECGTVGIYFKAYRINSAK